MAIICFVSHRPPSRDGGSVSRAQKKKEKKNEEKESTDCENLGPRESLVVKSTGMSSCTSCKITLS